MASKDEVVAAIQIELERRKKRIVNRNAFEALFSAVADPIGALGRIFLGRYSSVDAEKQRIAQDAVISLLCQVDDGLADLRTKLDRGGVPRSIVQGLIEAHGENVGEVTGAQIEEPVEFPPGTHIRASGRNAAKVTGLRIGKKDPDT
jgi:hypothetical protein